MARNLKRIKDLLLATLLVALMTGCGSTSNEKKSDEVQDAPEVQEMQMKQEVEVPTDAVNEQDKEQETEQDVLTEPEQDEPEQNEPEQDEPEDNTPDYNITGADNNTTSTQSNDGAEKIDTGVYPEGEQEVDSPEQGQGNGGNTSTSSNNSSTSSDDYYDDDRIKARADAIEEEWMRQILSEISPEEIEENKKQAREAIESGRLQGLSEWAASLGSSSNSSNSGSFDNSGIDISIGGATSSSDNQGTDISTDEDTSSSDSTDGNSGTDFSIGEDTSDSDNTGD